MTLQLFAARYEDHSYTGVAPAEVFSSMTGFKVRWNLLKFGIQSFEFTIRADSEIDAYNRFKNHLGQLIAIFDSYLDKCITGNVFEITRKGRLVTYICAGNTARLYDLLYNLTHHASTPLIPTDDTDVAIKDILDNATAVISTDQSNIGATGLNMGAWKPQGFDNEGMFAGRAIRELADMGDGSYNIWDFYLVDQRLDATIIQKPLPYFKQRLSTTSPDWQFGQRDIVKGGLTQGRNIWDWQSHIKVGYSRLSGRHDGAASAHLIDSTVDFEALGVSVGDRVHNITDGVSWTVELFVSTTTLDLVNSPSSASWATNERYVIELKELQWTAQSSDYTFWTRAGRPEFPFLDATTALIYRDQYAAKYNTPVLQQSFILSCPWLEDGVGALWPLWRPLFGNSFYFKARDLPEIALFDVSEDDSDAFIAVTMDYDHDSHRLRIVPSTGDSRLDVIIQEALGRDRRIREIASAA